MLRHTCIKYATGDLRLYLLCSSGILLGDADYCLSQGLPVPFCKAKLQGLPLYNVLFTRTTSNPLQNRLVSQLRYYCCVQGQRSCCLWRRDRLVR